MSAVRVCRAFIPSMRQSGWGRVVLVSSEDALQPYIEAIWYLFLKYKGFRKADLRSPATIRVQENEKS